ncbi:MAG: FumA C-terminus/TtdB family hydratase beta subunit [Thermodesulfovibrionales bacterium]|nr:FumA C-terminus/TtdB family hydratase beta subunit [Thermodesulfovibrionales bacterium]
MVNEKFKVKSSKLKVQKERIINLPLTKKDVLNLKVGDIVLINGMIVTGRDKMHKFLFYERPLKKDTPFNLSGTVLYHCGPIVIPTHPPLKKGGRGDFRVIASGPTTSIRVETYEHRIISSYGIRGVMGKGGMGEQTLKALKKEGCVYFHTIGGAAAYLADRIKRVVDVWKLEEFGMAEAMWLLEVENFPAIVTMDTHGRSLHKDIEMKSGSALKKLIK